MKYRPLLIATFLAVTYLQGAQPAELDSNKSNGELKVTVEHDCAPWDGAAFGLWIPAEKFGGRSNSWIHLRIWRAPEESRTTFIFPDQSQGQEIGTVMYYLDLKLPQSIVWQKQPRQELKGKVRFTRVNNNESVLGEFDFLSERNIHLKGNFEARWINKRALCG
ncbi:hypothetical protein [Synechocystis sp. LKSZ1]|uniref:hypothetical protein n=1 Tax=Synechocystis sp. LKSZ1 TaxID=3144951 RepID=UPI00336BBECE